MTYSPIEVAVALSLYGYNVSPAKRAIKLYEHFKGNCAEIEEMILILVNSTGWAVTELAFPTAEVYVQHALEKYGEEAKRRVGNEEYLYLVEEIQKGNVTEM